MKLVKKEESMKTFSRLMNMTEPINIKACNAINDHLLQAFLMAALSVVSSCDRS